MSNTLLELAAFAAATRYEDLPPAVVNAAKRNLLDSIGCGLASHAVDKGKMNIAVSRRLGGAPESTIFGVNGKVSPTSAALANGELINAMDYSSLYSPGGHASPNIIPAVLAIAESVGASGKEVIRAIAVAQEIAIRLSWGMSGISSSGPDGFRWTPVYGFARFNIGAAAGVALLLGLDEGRIANALGLAGHHSQIPSNAKFAHTPPPAAMTKYGTAGWQGTGAIVAGLLAEQGYVGDTTLFEGDMGFWRFAGSEKWEPEKVVDALGERWDFLELQYKPYPACRLAHAALDTFLALRDEHDVQAKDIEALKVISHPYGAHPNSLNTNITNNIDAQFSIPYIFSVASHRIPIGPEWQDAETMTNRDILAFMDKISYEVHAVYRSGEKLADHQMLYGGVEITLRDGTVLAAERDYASGTPRPGHEFTDEALTAKFVHNAQRLLTQAAIARTVDLAWKLEDVPDVNALMAEATPI